MRSSSLRRLVVGAVASLGIAAAACGDPTGNQTGRLSLLLTDAPGDIAEAVVTIDRIYLQGADGDTSGTGGRVILREDDITVDLLTLQDSMMAILDSALIPAGTYGQLRFVISGGYLSVVADDTTRRTIYASSPNYPGLPVGAVVAGELQMPSFAQSGLKIQLPGNAVQVGDDELVTLLIDFDVAQSFGRAAGNSGRWVMSPVIRATVPTPADTLPVITAP